MQTLLKLQTDIERENRQYYEAERQRISLLARAAAEKEKEMRSRLDKQQDEIDSYEIALKGAEK